MVFLGLVFMIKDMEVLWDGPLFYHEQVGSGVTPLSIDLFIYFLSYHLSSAILSMLTAYS